jgi:signal transduction histidine kinase/AmiR/NasT family two-component response regulator
MEKETPQLTALATLAGLVLGVGVGQGFVRAGYGVEALAGCGLLLVVATARFLWLGFALRAPIRRLTEVADRIAAGDLGVGAPRALPRELRRLGGALRRMVRRLRQTTVSRDDLDRLLGSMNGALLVVAPDGRVRSANANAGQLLRQPATALVGRTLVELAGPDGGPVARALTDPSGRQIEIELEAADGERVPVLLSMSRIAGRQDVVCVAQAIRAQRDVEAQLQRINVQLWLLNQVTTIALRTRELDPALSQIAEALRSAGGFSVVGFALRDHDQPELRMRTATGLAAGPGTVASCGPESGSILWQVVLQREPIILHLEGSSLELGDPLLGNVAAAVLGLFPMRVGGEVIGVAILGEARMSQGAEEFGRSGMDLAQHVAALVDQKLASEALHRSNQALELARMAAEDASRAKSDFLANMSHEIRTPMTAILGYADLVREDRRDADETAEFVDTIRRNGEHLMSIVNDILDLSKIEAGKVDLEVVPCSPVEVAREVVAMMQRRAEDRGIALDLDLVWPLPRRIDSDPTRIRQILVNLVGNAVKFTDAGSVRVLVRRHPVRETALLFEVIDTGIGMSASELGRLFKPFSQGDSSHSRRFGGTGLGLAISQRLAALLGGGIAVQSRRGSGSRFTVEIDGAPPRSAGDLHRLEDQGPIEPRPAPRSPARVEARVLLAEDGPDNQRLIAFLLRKAGAEVDVVGDGAAAVEMVLAAAADGCPYDLVLMDMQMPVLDGYAATRALRAQGYARPVVALTAHAMQGDEERCREAGCDHFLSKPIDRAALLATVAAAVERVRGAAAAVRQPAG